MDYEYYDCGCVRKQGKAKFKATWVLCRGHDARMLTQMEREEEKKG